MATILRRPAPMHVRAAVHSILTGQMAGQLILQKIDLSDRVAARIALETAGCGELTIANLLDRSIALARQTISQQERSNG